MFNNQPNDMDRPAYKLAKRFVHYDSESFKILGYYSDRIHKDQIPEPNLPITLEVLREINSLGHTHLNISEDGSFSSYFPEVTEEEILEQFRNNRNGLLIESDTYMLPDFPLDEEQRVELLEYRTALRDSTNTLELPDKPNFIK